MTAARGDGAWSESTPGRLAISGAAGRMGRRLIALAVVDDQLCLTAALEHDASDALGTDAGILAGAGAAGVPISAAVTADFDVMIDFTRPDALMSRLEECVARRRAMVIGTTGLDPAQREAVTRAGDTIPIVLAPNMSVGANVLLRMARLLGESLDPSYDVEIIEAHHRFKVDAPSGTAIALRDAVMAGRESQGAPATVVYGRQGAVGARAAGEIGMHAVRLGDTVGEHCVQFGALGETVSISHSAHSRDTFAAGALRAAKWLAHRPAGVYSMQDVLFGANRA